MNIHGYSIGVTNHLLARMSWTWEGAHNRNVAFKGAHKRNVAHRSIHSPIHVFIQFKHHSVIHVYLVINPKNALEFFPIKKVEYWR